MMKRGLKGKKRRGAVRRQERVCCQRTDELEEQGGVLLEGEVRGLWNVWAHLLLLRFADLCVPAGRGRPLRGLRRSRQERHSKDATKLFLLYDDHILDNDPFRESKDVAFAQSYLRRVRGAAEVWVVWRCLWTFSRGPGGVRPHCGCCCCFYSLSSLTLAPLCFRCVRLCRTILCRWRTLCPSCTTLSSWEKARK